MPSSGALRDRGRELAAQIEKINLSEMSAAEKSAALDKIAPDWEAHKRDIANSERASQMRNALLGDGGDTKAADPGTDEFSPDKLRVNVPNLKQAASAFGLALLKSGGYQKVLGGLGGRDGMKGKSNFDERWDVSLKDSTAANNVMGEGLFGSSGPTAIGQNPFASGAFGPGILPQFLPGVVEQRFYPLSIADLFTSIPTDAPNISYLVESTANFNASSVAEGGAYPFSSEEFSRVYEQIAKIANAVEVTDEVVRDAPFLFNFLQGRLVEGIQRQEEVQLLAGSGYPQVNGLLNRASSFTQGTNGLTPGANIAFPASATPGAGSSSATISSLAYGRQALGVGSAGTPPTAAQIAETIFAAIVDIQTSIFFTPNAVVCNPADWHTIRIGKDANGQYYGGSFFGADYGYTANVGNGYSGNPGNTIWNTRVVQTPAIPAGNILVGYFGPEVANTIRRDGISVQMTNTNGTNFVDGEVTLRAEERVGLAVYRPKAFELIQLANAA